MSSPHLRIEIAKPDPSPEESKLHNKKMRFYTETKPITIYTLTILVLSLVLYLITLKGCPSFIMMECVPLIVPLIPLGLLVLWLSSLFLVFGLKIVLRGSVNHRFYILIVFELLTIWVISTGTTFQNHGLFNKMIFILFLVINILGITFLQYLYRLYKSHPRHTILFGGVLIVLCFLQIRNIWTRGSCERWDKGLKGTIMQNHGTGCDLAIPDMCFHELTSDWFDLSNILGKNKCHNFTEDIKLGEGKLLGFPKTQYFKREEKFIETYQYHVLGLVKEINEQQINNGEYEVFLNQSVHGEAPSLNINIRYNKSIANRSHNILTEKGPAKFKNILTIFIDSVSRQHFSRKLPKTLKFIEERYQSSDFLHESFQFFKYHASGTHTLPNMMRAFYGADFRNPAPAESLAKTFKSQGYVTAKSSGLCSPTHFDVSQTDKTLKDFDIESFDHENIAFSCDPNYRRITDEGPHSYLRGSSAMVRRCLYGNDVHSYVLEYGEKFWRTYAEEPKFLELDLMDGHEPSAELIKFLDDPLEKFLRNFDKQGLLNDTTIVFYADHGHHLNFFYYLFGLKDLMYELKLPVLYILFPKNIADEYRTYMHKLENVLISGFDLYNFYNAVAGSKDRINFGINFFEEVDFGRGWRDLDLEENLMICKKR